MRKLSPEARRAAKAQLYDDLAAGLVELPEAVRRMRLITGLTQAEFAARIAGISSSALAQIERGESNPRLDTLNKIGRAFGLVIRFGRATRERA